MPHVDDILDCPMGPNDAGADTVREYLKALLVRLWDVGEGFSGKRPFGNSGWEWDLIEAVTVHFFPVETDEWGESEPGQDQELRARRMITDAIKALS